MVLWWERGEYIVIRLGSFFLWAIITMVTHAKKNPTFAFFQILEIRPISKQVVCPNKVAAWFMEEEGIGSERDYYTV